ncbi:reverse transcriptase domain-containing protein [Micromonospora sp. NPDC023966]|uniref:reverse transcriptase domain-containing protein n=1 Tax=Micromonospora sp. NPDC023966 TaxID=3154699 RepID=UPI0033F6CED7
MIPKPGSLKKRRLGIPTVADRVVQASLKLVLEPIFEADFHPCSFGFRPRRRAQDAIADIHLLTSKSYEWILEADIEACFDSIDHAALMARVRRRVGDKRVLSLVKAFLKAGILTETGSGEETHTGTPQGGILSPLRGRRLPGVRLHDLRHTVVSLLMELGVPPHVVQAIARHADVKITLKVYAHANLDAMRQALGKLDGRLS